MALGGAEVWESLLEIRIVDPAFLYAWYGLSAILVLYLIAKQWTIRWFLVAFLALFLGFLAGGALLWVAVNVLNLFGGPVDDAVWVWVPVATAAITLAIGNLWGSRWWRKVIALVSIAVFAVTAVFAVNASTGIDRTLGSLLHVSTADPITPPALLDPATPVPSGPLYSWWQAPEGMPTEGRTGEVAGGIPNAASGFEARPAQLYLPPAALVEQPPRLPLVVFMMSRPGDPDVSFLAETLDAFAAEHAGLAPIALVIDQLGEPWADPLCLDTDRGAVETYVLQDVVPWARATLNVQAEPRFWTVGGYGNGGQCALSFGAKSPEVFGNLLDVSGEEFPGADHQQQTLEEVFGGDAVAYQMTKPSAILAAKAPYADSWAVFTVGTRDGHVEGAVERNAAAATTAGMHVLTFEVEGAGHGADALVGGLEAGFDALYPRLELAPPAETMAEAEPAPAA